jgi:biopolymer transport protein ExbD
MGTLNRSIVTRPAASGGWAGRVPPLLIRLAARKAPPPLSERLEEEWLADLSEQPGQLARLRLALGCSWAAMVIRHDHQVEAIPVTTSICGEKTMMAHAHRGVVSFSRRTSPPTHGSAVCEINITPLIDVMLVLLITLIFSLPLMTHAIKIDMPRPGAASNQTPPEVINLDIEFDGTLVWNGTVLTGLEQLEGYLRTAARKDPQPEIHLHPDRLAKYDYVAKVLASAQHNRLQRMGFVNTGELNN